MGKTRQRKNCRKRSRKYRRFPKKGGLRSRRRRVARNKRFSKKGGGYIEEKARAAAAWGQRKLGYGSSPAAEEDTEDTELQNLKDRLPETKRQNAVDRLNDMQETAIQQLDSALGGSDLKAFRPPIRNAERLMDGKDGVSELLDETGRGARPWDWAPLRRKMREAIRAEGELLRAESVTTPDEIQKQIEKFHSQRDWDETQRKRHELYERIEAGMSTAAKPKAETEFDEQFKRAKKERPGLWAGGRRRSRRRSRKRAR